MARLKISHFALHLPLFLLGSGLVAGACSNDGRVDADGDSDSQQDSDSDLDGHGSDLDGGGLDLDLGGGGEGGGNGQAIIIYDELPPGFSPSTNPDDADPEYPAQGGYKLVGELSEVQDKPQEGCGNILRAVSRDFLAEHPDFFNTDAPNGPNYVLPELGDDRKPIVNPATVATSLIEAFDDWYNNTPASKQYVVEIWLEPVGDSYVFSSGLYFPLDGLSDETNDGHDGLPHNFLFTTELHTAFKYKGTESFTFRGDDDVYVFVNGKLAVDLGGVHGIQTDTFDLAANADEFGLVVGETYPLDLFHAERKPSGSNFRIETTLDFTECGEILPGDIVR